MSNLFDIEMDPDNQRAVPTVWRKTLASIADAIAKGDFALACGIDDVAPIDVETASAIADAISDYGVQLVPLPPETWLTSVCQWMGSYWNVLVDLHSQEEGRSDLVLQVTVTEVEQGYAFEVYLVYVP